jgi:ferredoxin
METSIAQPHVTFKGQDIAGVIDPSETLLEWGDERDVEMDSECWIGMCGCDAIRVLEGGEYLNEPDEKEIKTLTLLPPCLYDESLRSGRRGSDESCSNRVGRQVLPIAVPPSKPPTDVLST